MARRAQSTVAEKPKNPRRDPISSGERDASQNRAASHNYFLLEKFEAGIALRGTEVKSIRAGRANLKDAYGLVKDGELWLINAHIGEYEHGNIFNHEPVRTRKLLVHKNELYKLMGKTQQKGLTLIPHVFTSAMAGRRSSWHWPRASKPGTSARLSAAALPTRKPARPSPAAANPKSHEFVICLATAACV